MRIAVFQSHPIQYFAHLWRELARRPGVRLTAFYYSRHAVSPTVDPGFGVPFAWDVDLLSGYEHEFLPRRWPTRDPEDPSWNALNAGITQRLHAGWDAAYVAGYAHLNNWIVARACRRLGIPLLCQIDSSMILERDRSAAFRRLKGIVVSAFFRNVAIAMPVSGHGRDYLLHYGVPAERIVVCPYSVDVERFREAARNPAEDAAKLRARYGIPPGRRIVAFCGKLADRKRPLDLVAALHRLGRDDVIGLFIGDGALRRDVEAAARGRAIVTGFVNQSELPGVLALADLLVLPSSLEAFGLVVVEAQALGIPGIVSDRCGCQGPGDAIQDGENGFIYPCGDVEALAERLARLLDDEGLRSEFARRSVVTADRMGTVAVVDLLLEAARRAQATRN